MYVPSDALPLYQILKQSNNLLIGYGDIAFKRFGEYSECSHECSCSSTRSVKLQYQRTSGGYHINPHIKLYVLGIDNAMPLYTQTDRLNTIVLQPLRGSTKYIIFFQFL